MNARTTTIRRIRRLLTVATASAVAAGLGLGSAGSAQALPPGGGIGGIGGGGIIVVANNGGMTGTVDLGGCNIAPSNLQVVISRVGTLALGQVTALGGGRYTYTAGDLPEGTYQVLPTIMSNECQFGWWDAAPMYGAVTAGIMGPGPSLQYRLPSKIARIPGAQVAAAIGRAAGDARMSLHNLGARSGATRYAANASTTRFSGSAGGFDLAEGNYDVDACGICPDFGDAHYYANNVATQRATATWQGSGVTFALGFAPRGEVKGYFTPTGTSMSIDSAMPDVEFDDGIVSADLRPTIDATGVVTMVPTGTAAFAGTMNKTFTDCNILEVWNVCAAISNFKTKMGAAAKGALVGTLRGTAAKTAIREQMATLVAGYGITAPRSVFVSGSDLIVTQ